MLMDLDNLVRTYNTTPITGILHLGAHLGEEAASYERLGIPHVWWVEANPDVLPKLRAVVSKYHNQEVIESLVTDKEGEVFTFNVTNYDGMSSSVFEFGTHTEDSPDTVYVKTYDLVSHTVDTIVAQHGITANFWNLDVQGAELLALRGATEYLKTVDFIYSEVSTGPVYLGGALMQEIDDYLPEFKRVETDMGMHRGKHGDAFYVRKP